MNRDDRFRSWGYCGFYLIRVYIVGLRVYIHEHGQSAGHERRACRGDEGVGGDDNLVAVADFEGTDGDLDGRRSIRAGDPILSVLKGANSFSKLTPSVPPTYHH